MSNATVLGSAVTASEMVEALSAQDAPEFVENFDAETRRIAAFLLANMPEGMREHARAQIERIAGGLTDERLYGMDFERETVIDGAKVHATATLYVETASFGSRSERLEDSAGNLWHRTIPEVKVSWSSWGSAPLAVSMYRLALINEVAALAAMVEEAFRSPLYSLIMSAEARAAAKVEQAKQEQIRQVVNLALDGRTRVGMRVGEKRLLSAAPPYGLPADFVTPFSVGGGKSKLSYVIRLQESGPDRTLVLVIERVATELKAQVSS